VRTVLRICDVPRSTYYYHLKHALNRVSHKSGGRPIPGYSYTRDGKKVTDNRIKLYIQNLLSKEESVYGYRKMTQVLRQRYRLCINKKKVYRLFKELNILLPQREVKNKVPRKLANNRVVTGPNQLWQLDIKYGYVTGSRRHFYLASAIDVFDRSIVGYVTGKASSTESILTMLQRAVMKRNACAEEQSLVIRTDNGPQFCSKAFHTFCETMAIEHERTPPRTPNKNAYIESFHSVLERECYQRNFFETFTQAFKVVDKYIRFYNERRLHGSLNDLPPAVYLAKVRKGEIMPHNIAL
jgi:putative transposase